MSSALPRLMSLMSCPDVIETMFWVTGTDAGAGCEALLKTWLQTVGLRRNLKVEWMIVLRRSFIKNIVITVMITPYVAAFGGEKETLSSYRVKMVKKIYEVMI